ncbi:MAG TPA: cupin domain-containing protein, partial [Thermoanaerobaculia bacterium]|nr:cupin domain-containing protein [Thermoanaerobaculia bacterium]
LLFVGYPCAVSGVRLERWDPRDGPLSEKRTMGLLERERYEVASFAYRSFSHEHAQDKCDGVVEGVLRVTVAEAAFDLGPGDRIYLPAGTRHSAEVVGSNTVVSLDSTRWWPLAQSGGTEARLRRTPHCGGRRARSIPQIGHCLNPPRGIGGLSYSGSRRRTIRIEEFASLSR